MATTTARFTWRQQSTGTRTLYCEGVQIGYGFEVICGARPTGQWVAHWQGTTRWGRRYATWHAAAQAIIRHYEHPTTKEAHP